MPSQVGTAIIEGSTDIQVTVRVLDDPTGAPELNVTSTTGGIQFYFWRRGSLLSSFDLVSTLGGLASAHDEGGITSILNGYHRLDIPNSAFVTGASAVFIGGVMTSGIIIGQEFQLVTKQVDNLNDVPLTAFDGVTVSALGNDVIGSAVIAAGAIDKGDQLIGLTDLPQSAVASAATSALITYDPATHAELSIIGGDVSLILADTGTDGVVIATAAIGAGQFAAGAIDAAALAADAGTEIADAVWAKVLESNANITAQQIMQAVLAFAAGVTANSGATLKTPDGVATRITATIDGSQNRTTMVLNFS